MLSHPAAALAFSPAAAHLQALLLDAAQRKAHGAAPQHKLHLAPRPLQVLYRLTQQQAWQGRRAGGVSLAHSIAPEVQLPATPSARWRPLAALTTRPVPRHRAPTRQDGLGARILRVPHVI